MKTKTQDKQETNKQNGYKAPSKKSVEFEPDNSPAAKAALKAFRLTYNRVTREK